MRAGNGIERDARVPNGNTKGAPATETTPRVSVLMPTFEQASFIRRAVESLLSQSLQDWELVIVDDGSLDCTEDVVSTYLSDCRVRYYRFNENRGLGWALNHAMDNARGQYIAYLPSDDVYYPDHLTSLLSTLEADQGAFLAYSGVRHHYNRYTAGQIEGHPLQLVQVMHRGTDERWLTRDELVTDDLARMLWSRLERLGAFIATQEVTCEWVDHPDQLHKVIQEPEGGIASYRQRYRVSVPMRFHSTRGNRIDEVEQYARFRARPDTPFAADGLKILLVGELAYNADRVLALEERGHKLYGLWMPRPYWYNTVGPLPFGHVEDISRNDWRTELRRIQPDVIYALLNWQAVPFAHEVLTHNPGIPFVWHFKEGPFICLEKGTWREMVELYEKADGQVYTSPEMRDWLETVLPGLSGLAPSLVLDGDLPKWDWFTGEPAARLSRQDGEIHTVVPGRPIGLHPHNVAELVAEGVHLHFYGDFTQGQWKAWIAKTQSLVGKGLHLHPHVHQSDWVSEFSRYDAGWLHFMKSDNEGDIRRSNWDDLNYPARMSTLAAAGLPMIQFDNQGAIVATQELTQRLGVGLFATDMPGVAARLNDGEEMAKLWENAWKTRQEFSFDYHADALIEFFRTVIESAGKQTGTGSRSLPLLRKRRSPVAQT